MKLSEFRLAVDDEFGAAYGAVLTRDLVLDELGERTPSDAVDAGIPIREVWSALCRAMGVPSERIAGAGRPEPRR